MSDDLATRRNRILLNLDIISVINDHLAKIDDVDLLENVHGSVTLHIVKGQFHSIEATSSTLIAPRASRRRAA